MRVFGITIRAEVHWKDLLLGIQWQRPYLFAIGFGPLVIWAETA